MEMLRIFASTLMGDLALYNELKSITSSSVFSIFFRIGIIYS